MNILFSVTEHDNTILVEWARRDGISKAALLRRLIYEGAIIAGFKPSEDYQAPGRPKGGDFGPTLNQKFLKMLRTDPERFFWSHVEKLGPDECWPWVTQSYSPDRPQILGQPISPNQVAWELTYRELLPGEQLQSDCKCCNPSHSAPAPQD